jgi:hypothetical protein
MIELLLTNLNILLKSNYYNKISIVKFNILLRSNYYTTIINQFKYFIKISLL